MPPRRAKNPSELLMLLHRHAQQAAQHAYAPYSGFQVGAALASEEGEIFTGANVENASYGLTICAERAAVAAAVSAGARKFTALALYCAKAEKPLFPCGACLQVLAEFAEDLQISSEGADHKWHQTTLKALLPQPFQK